MRDPSSPFFSVQTRGAYNTNFFREILANEFENMSRTDFFGGFSYDNSLKTRL